MRDPKKCFPSATRRQTGAALRQVILQYGFAAAFAVISAPHAMAQSGPPAPQVTVASPVQKTVAEWDEYTGRFEATQQVEVRARVSGFLDNIHFVDGQIVRQGETLFTIDPRTSKIAVDSAQADLAKAKAQVVQAANDLDRASQLVRSSAITERDVDTRKATLDIARASQKSAEAALQSASLNLEWTKVQAPISGRISDRKVDVGNLVTGGQSSTTLLTNIVSIDPIHFVFDASEADYLRAARRNNGGQKTGPRSAGIKVQLKLSDENDWIRDGTMNFLDNQVNSKSGTIRGRAIFNNTDGFLTPGVFGRIRVFAGETEALLIPDAAISSDQARKLVLAVGPENVVVPKPVVLGPIVDGLRVVRSGLDPKDQVIIGGLANPLVRPGGKVVPAAGEIKVAK